MKLFGLKKLGEIITFWSSKKTLINEHRKNYIFRDNNCFVKMSVSLVSQSVGNQIFVWTGELA